MRASLAERCCSFTIGRHAPVPASRDFFFASRRLSVRLRKSPTDADRRAARASMEPRDELLKSIWHAFTALDVDQSGKVSKSQLKVNSAELGARACVRACVTVAVFSVNHLSRETHLLRIGDHEPLRQFQETETNSNF